MTSGSIVESRPHQTAAKKAVIEDFDAGYRKLIVSMATGTGKTFFFSDLYHDIQSRLPGKMLVLAHTEELVDQNIAALRLVHPDKKIDKEMAGAKADPATADIIVASVATLGRKGTSRLAKYDWSQWDKVIVDEAHHTPALSYRNVLDAAGVMVPNSDKLLLGVTATTQRSDGKALADYYGRISYTYGLQQAIKDGWLVDIRGYRVDTTVNLDAVGNSGGDFQTAQLADKVNNPARNERVVSAWENLGEQRKTVVFAVDIAHAQALAKEFEQRGHACAAIWGNDPDRGAKLADHKAGQLKILVNVGILVEGYDDPSIECIVIARPTQSECLFTQMCGRGTRLNSGKKDLVIIDVVDNTSTHSLMTLPSLMGLPNCLDLKGGSAMEAKEKLEELQEKYPNVDFVHLKCVDDAEGYVEQINMFEVRFPSEVEENSEFRWCKTVDGGYRIHIPGPALNMVGEPVKRGPSGNVTIHKNILGEWEINGQIKDDKFHGKRPTMETAFVTADNAIRERASQLLTYVNRKESWHGQPLKSGSPQDKLLRKLYPGKPFPVDMTRGQASFWIDKKIGRKKI